MAENKTDKELMDLLCEFDTPTITNVVATYPAKKETCLGLYDPWSVNWYTDQSLQCMFPELGRMCGYAVTAVYGLPSPSFNRLSFVDVLRAVDASPKPAILLIKQDQPDHIRNKNGLAGGNMITALKNLGAVGLISDGPSRDVDEIRELGGFQYMLTGVTAGHGTNAVKAVNVPVSICGMDVAPGEIVHMDENGAVKFPVQYLAAIYERACILREEEARRMKALGSARNIEELITYWQGTGY